MSVLSLKYTHNKPSFFEPCSLIISKKRANLIKYYNRNSILIFTLSYLFNYLIFIDHTFFYFIAI